MARPEAQVSTRVVLYMVGAILVLATLVTPWWTRGVTFTDGEATDGETFWFGPPGTEGLYFQYGPFMAASDGRFSSDASREASAAVLGVGWALTAAAVSLHLLLRFGAWRSWWTASQATAERSALVATWAGIFTVLWGALLLPVLGSGGGTLWSGGGADEVRYANAGLYIGLVGLVGFPVYLWRLAAMERLAASASARAVAA